MFDPLECLTSTDFEPIEDRCREVKLASNEYGAERHDDESRPRDREEEQADRNQYAAADDSQRSADGTSLPSSFLLVLLLKARTGTAVLQ